MAAVVAVKNKKRKHTRRGSGTHEDRKGVKEYQVAELDVEKGDEKPHQNGGLIDFDYDQWKVETDAKNDIENGDVIGIITMEDVMEELLQVPHLPKKLLLL